MYDNNQLGRRLTLMRDLYGYADASPISVVDPTGLLPTGPCTNRGQVIIHVNKISVKDLEIAFKNLAGSSLPAPLSPGFPSAGAIGTAALKGILNKILNDLDVTGVGKVLSTELLGISTAEAITLISATATAVVAVDAVVSMCVPDTEPCLFFFTRNLDTSHWETSNKTLSVNVPVANVNLTTIDNSNVGVMVTDANGLNKALSALKSDIQASFATLDAKVGQQLKNTGPNTTVEMP
jgi:hypothetical protein